MIRVLSLFLIAGIIFSGCQVISDPTPEDCREIGVIIETISEGSSADINLLDSQSGNWYYINQGLERNLSLQNLRSSLLDKPAKLWVVKNGRYVAQIMVEDSIVYTEFSE